MTSWQTIKKVDNIAIVNTNDHLIKYYAKLYSVIKCMYLGKKKLTNINQSTFISNVQKLLHKLQTSAYKWYTKFSILKYIRYKCHQYITHTICGQIKIINGMLQFYALSSQLYL